MGQHTACTVVRLPYYGGPWNLLRRSDGRRRIPARAWNALHGALGAFADPAQLPAAVYCKYCRLDDCRDRSPTVTRLRTAPPVGWLLETDRLPHVPLHSPGLPYAVYPHLHPLDPLLLHHRS